ncbi:MAG: hypothetical protein ABEJ93_04875 [Candidatus Nanohalobium sp.]
MKKGQVAIENLMTYGWMLLAVALVTGSLMSSSVSSFCNEGISGFSVHQLKIDDYGYRSGNLSLQIRNGDARGFENQINSIKVLHPELDREVSIKPYKNLDVGEEALFQLSNFSESSSCNRLEIRISYDRGNVLKNQIATGELVSRIKINKSSEPDSEASYFDVSITSVNTAPAGDNTSFSYSVENTGGLGTQTVNVSVDGSQLSSSSVSLDPGETFTANLEYKFGSAGTHSFTVESENTTDSSSFSVDPAVYRVENLEAPGEANLGSNIDVSADIVSESKEGSATAELRVGNDIFSSYSVLKSKSVDVPEDTSVSVEFVNANVDSSLGEGDKELGVVYKNGNASQPITLYDRPSLESFVVKDNEQYGNADYTVEYEVSNLASFQEVRVIFDNQANDWSDGTYTSSDAPTGSVSHSSGSEGDTFNITVEVLNTSSAVTDWGNVTDVSDGSNTYYPQDLGGGKENPDFKDVNLSDNSNTVTDSTRFEVEYELNKTTNFQEVKATFNNLQNDWSDAVTTNSSSPEGTLNYQDWGTTGQDYNITVEVINSDGIPVDTRKYTETADGNPG